MNSHVTTMLSASGDLKPLRPRKFKKMTLLRSFTDVFDEDMYNARSNGFCGGENLDEYGDDDSEDEEFYRRQIMEFDVSKYNSSSMSERTTWSKGLVLVTASILVLTLALISQVYGQIRSQQTMGTAD